MFILSISLIWYGVMVDYLMTYILHICCIILIFKNSIHCHYEVIVCNTSSIIEPAEEHLVIWVSTSAIEWKDQGVVRVIGGGRWVLLFVCVCVCDLH